MYQNVKEGFSSPHFREKLQRGSFLADFPIQSSVTYRKILLTVTVGDWKGRSHRCVVISVPEHLDKFTCWFLDTRRPKRISDDITTSRLLKRRRNDVTNFFSMALRHMQVSPQTGMSGYIHIPQFISYTKPLGKYCNLRFFFIFCDSAAVAVVVVGIVYSCAEYVRLQNRES